MHVTPSDFRLSRLPLPVKIQPTLTRQLTSSLLKPQVFLAYAKALQEHAVHTNGSLYYLTINLHAEQSLPAAAKSVKQMVNSLMDFSWRWAVGASAGSCLSAQANGARTLAVVTFEKEAAGGYHTHGFLYVPTGRLMSLSGGRRFNRSFIHVGLRVVQDFRRLHLEPFLHPESVHLIPIHPYEQLAPYSNYSTDGWGWESAHETIVDLFPGGKVAHDWHPVSRRAATLVEQLAADARSAAASAVARAQHLSAVARGLQPSELAGQRKETVRWNVSGGEHSWQELFGK